MAARNEHRIRYDWRSFVRMPHVDVRNLLIELSPWRYAHMHRRNFARFVGDRLSAPDALPCYISVTRLRDGKGFLLGTHEVERPIDLLLAANYLPPFYTRTPVVLGEKFGDGGVPDNAPYELAFEKGCDTVVLVTPMHLGDLRTREVLLGERYAETDVRATGESPSVRLMRGWRRVRGSAAAARGPAEPVQP